MRCFPALGPWCRGETPRCHHDGEAGLPAASSLGGCGSGVPGEDTWLHELRARGVVHRLLLRPERLLALPRSATVDSRDGRAGNKGSSRCGCIVIRLIRLGRNNRCFRSAAYAITTPTGCGVGVVTHGRAYLCLQQFRTRTKTTKCHMHVVVKFRPQLIDHGDHYLSNERHCGTSLNRIRFALWPHSEPRYPARTSAMMSSPLVPSK